MKKNHIRFIALILTLLMCVTVFASCKKDPTPSPTPSASSSENEPSSSTSGGDPEPSASASPTGTSLESLMPVPVNLNREMSILHGRLYYDEFLVESDDGDIVRTELFQRKRRVEENLGIELDLRITVGTDEQDFLNKARNAAKNSDPAEQVDVISQYSQYSGILTLEGFYQNIADNEHLNLSNPWWPKNLLAASSFDDKVYFVSGDISPTLIYETYGIFFNSSLIESYGFEDPISLASNKQWTIDKLIGMTVGIYEDLNPSETAPSSGDFFAFTLCDQWHGKCLPFGLGMRVVEPDSEKGYVISPKYSNEKADSIMKKLGEWITSNDGVCVDPAGYGISFINGSSIFVVGNFAYPCTSFANSTVAKYGVVPIPMWDEDQGEYYSYYGNPSSFWSVPVGATNVDDSCRLIESLAADAYIKISPALFEIALKFKYVPTSVDGLSHMYDIIRESLVFDAVMFYRKALSGYNEFTEIFSSASTTWNASIRFKVATMNKQIKTVVTTLQKLP